MQTLIIFNFWTNSLEKMCNRLDSLVLGATYGHSLVIQNLIRNNDKDILSQIFTFDVP